MNSLKVAICGCGAVGKAHLARWRNLAGIQVAALCDKNAALVASTAAPIPNCAAFTSIEELLQGEHYDIVDVCLPAQVQPEAIAAALCAKAHVVCEAPFTGVAEKAERLIRIAQEQERLLMPLFAQRYYPPCLFLKDLLDNDDLGKPLMFRCRFGSPSGELAELGVLGSSADALPLSYVTALHAIDLYRHFCGEVVSTVGRFRQIKGLPYETLVFILDGELCLGTVEVMIDPPAGQSALEVYGTAGAAVVDYGAGIIYYQTADMPAWYTRREEGRDKLERALAHFAEAVWGLTSLEIRPEEGLRALQVLEAGVHG